MIDLPVFTSSSNSIWSLSNTWATRCSIAGINFVSGHQYFYMATWLLRDANFNIAQARVQANGTVVPGSFCSFMDNPAVVGYRFFSSIGFFTGTGAGNGLEVQAYTPGTGGMGNSIGRIRLVAFDLSVGADDFPNSAYGWLKFESGSTPINLTASWQQQCSYSFLPDGESSYLVIGSLELSGSEGLQGYKSATQMVIGGSDYPYHRSQIYQGTDGATVNAIMAAVLPTPSGSQSISLQALQETLNSGFGVANYGKILVLRLNTFVRRSYGYNATGGSWADANEHSIQTSGTPAGFGPTPQDGDQYLVFRRVEPYNPPWPTTNRADKLYERATISTLLDSMDSAQEGVFPAGNSQNILLAPTILNAAGFAGWDLRIQNGGTTGPAYRRGLIVALKAQVSAPKFTSPSSSIVVDGSSAPSVLKSVSAPSDILVSGDALVERWTPASCSAGIQVLGNSLYERLRGVGAAALIQFDGNAIVVLATTIPLPSMARPYSIVGEIRPAELSELRISGDVLKNNLMVILSASQLGLDPSFTGDDYTFEGPPDPLSDPIQLGLRKGDKILLLDVGGGPLGPNHGKTFTLIDPASKSVLELLAHPDGKSYKFYAIKRGV